MSFLDKTQNRSDPSTPNKGRPKKSFRKDEDRHAVALIDMMLHTKSGGKRPSKQMAAFRAAFLKEAALCSQRFIPAPPKPELASSGQRNAPINPAFKNGYVETELAHSSRRPGGNVLVTAAERLRYKHRDWSQDPIKQEWMRFMANAWLAALCPEIVRAHGKDPASACRFAAELAGELSFWEQVLVRELAKRDVGARNHENKNQ